MLDRVTLASYVELWAERDIAIFLTFDNRGQVLYALHRSPF